MKDSERNIYKKDGSLLTDVNGKPIKLGNLEYSGEWMGTCNVTVDISNEAPIKFTIGDYLIYRGERFEINYDPGKIKSEAKDWSGEAFKYNGVVFNSMQDELVRSEFLDVVLNDNKAHYTALPKFAFYIDNLDGIADRLQANMDEQYGKGVWHFYTRNQGRSHDRGCDDAVWEKTYGTGITDNEIESTSISISSQSCWDVLALVNSQFDVNFIVRGRNVFIGTVGTVADHIFQHGKGKGLYEIEETADSKQSVVTRLRAYGSDKNLPDRYYAELGARVVANVKTITSKSCDSLTSPMGCTFILDMNYVNAMNAFTTPRPDNTDEAGNTHKWPGYYIVMATFDDVTKEKIYVRKPVDVEGRNVMAETKWYEPTETSARENQMKFIRAIEEGKTMYMTDGVNVNKMPSKNIEYTSDLPNNMAVDTLMLPGFPGMSLKKWWDGHAEDHEYLNPTGKAIRFSEDKYRPYIESPNVDEIGVRPSSVFFDTDNEKEGLKDIYPTIKEMEVGGVRIDEIDTGTEATVTDDGVYKEGQTVPNFNIKLKKEIDIDLHTLAEDDFTIHMQDGMCGGREFKVAAVARESDKRWNLRLERQQDNDLGLWFPYKDFPISAGDHFVLTGIKMPEEYIENASKELLRYAIAKLNDNDYTRKTYSPKVDEIFMARQNDEAEADETGATRSIHQTLKEGDIMFFEDTDLDIDKRITIERLNIKEQDGKIPTYDITLKEEKEVGTIQKIQNQVSSIVSGSYGEGGFTNSQIEGMVTAVCKNLYLSKVSKDTARALITFLKGIILGTDYSISELGDAILRSIKLGDYGIDTNGNATLGNIEAGEIESADYSDTTQSGYGIIQRRDGKYKMSLTDLEVWGKAIFHELEIRKLSYVGGNYIFSPAGCTLTSVEAQTNAVRCYFLADDGSASTEQMWCVNDLALCEEFDTRSTDAGNKRYWRKVVGVSDEAQPMYDADGNVLYDGKKFHYIDLSTKAGEYEEGSDEPQAGDVLCCLGNATDTERQNAIVIQTIGEKAPAFIQYDEVDTFTLSGKDKTIISPKGNKFIGDFYARAGGASLSVQIDDATERLDNLEDEQAMVSLKVDNATTDGRNLVPNSRLKLWSNGYDVARRDVMLEKGKAYTMSVRGMADSTLVKGGGRLTMFLYNDDWTYTKTISISARTLTTQSISFSDVPEDGTYHVSAYAYHSSQTTGYNNMKPQERGRFYIDYIQIERGSVATAWAASENDAVVMGNLLTRIDEGGWLKASGVDMTTDAYIVDGRHTTVAHVKNTTDNVMFTAVYPINTDGQSTYTLSFWAKGTGTIGTYLYPGTCMLTEDNYGHSEEYHDGGVTNVLTEDWRKYVVRFSTAYKMANLLQDAAFDQSASGWRTYGTWVKDENALDNYTAMRMTAIGSQYGEYGEIIQDVAGITKGTTYTLSLNVQSEGMSVYMMNVSPSNVYVDGVAKSISNGRIDLTADTSWTEHHITFVAGASGTMVLYLRSTKAGLCICKPILSVGHIASVFRPKEDASDNLLPARLSSGGELWISGIKLEKNYKATEYTERTLTAAQLLPTGIDIERGKITATADNFEVRNRQGEVTTTVTADGQLTAGILSTQNKGEGYLRAEDGMMEVFNPDGQTNIRFGLDKNSGMMVLQYYNNQGVLLYDLGPGGITNKGLQTASLTQYKAEHAGTFFNNLVKVPTTFYSDDVYTYVNADEDGENGEYVIDEEFRKRLVPSETTTVGYEPASALGRMQYLYYYQAGRVQTAYALDEENGITTEAEAKEADQKWFGSKPICVEGDMQYTKNGTYILDGEKLHWGTRKSGLKQLAVYMYYIENGVRERLEVFVGD